MFWASGLVSLGLTLGVRPWRSEGAVRWRLKSGVRGSLVGALQEHKSWATQTLWEQALPCGAAFQSLAQEAGIRKVLGGSVRFAQEAAMER